MASMIRPSKAGSSREQPRPKPAAEFQVEALAGSGKPWEPGTARNPPTFPRPPRCQRRRGSGPPRRQAGPTTGRANERSARAAAGEAGPRRARRRVRAGRPRPRSPSGGSRTVRQPPGNARRPRRAGRARTQGRPSRPRSAGRAPRSRAPRTPRRSVATRSRPRPGREAGSGPGRSAVPRANRCEDGVGQVSKGGTRKEVAGGEGGRADQQ